MKFKLEFKDIYGQKISSESSNKMLFNVVKDPYTGAEVYYMIYAEGIYNKITKNQYEILKDFIQDEHGIIDLIESKSYIFRGKVDDIDSKDKGREIYLGQENYENLCVKIALDEEIKTCFVFEDLEEDIILQDGDFGKIQEIVKELKNSDIGNISSILNSSDGEDDHMDIVLEMDDEEEIEEEVVEQKASITDFINNLKSESLSQAIKNKK